MWIETIVLRKEATFLIKPYAASISNSEKEIPTDDSGSHDYRLQPVCIIPHILDSEPSAGR